MALYAFNAEIAHAPWATREPNLAMIRLQYWYDQIEALFAAEPVDKHPALNVLRRLEVLKKLEKTDFTGLIDARRWDVWSEPFGDTEEMQAYLRATGGALMAMGARLLGVDEQHDGAMRAYGQASALAAFFVAVPVLMAHGHRPLVMQEPAVLAALAGEALAKMDAVGNERGLRAALPVLLSVSEARPVLRRVMDDPGRVLAGRLERSPFRQRARLLACQALGRW